MSSVCYYSRFFSKRDDFYGDCLDQNGELLKDCFDFAIGHANADKGLAVLAAMDGRVISSYDFGIGSRAEEYEGKIISNAREDDQHEYSSRAEIRIADVTGYSLYFFSNEHVNEDVSSLIENVSAMIEGVFKLSKKHSEYGDMVLRALDNVNDAISYCDAHGYIRYANKACFEILETNSEELLGHNLVNLTSGKPMLREILKNKKSIIDVEYFVKYRGKKFHFINSGYPVYSDEGSVIGAIDIFRSIERSRKFATSIAGYQAFFTFESIIGNSQSMVELVKHAKLFAKSDETVRIIAATNRNLEQLVEEGKFRRDLYYRLKVLCLETPPLREREKDVVLLAEYFMQKMADKSGKKIKAITDDAKKTLLGYDWPGNVRELENLIARAIFICEGDEMTGETLSKAGIREPNYDEIVKKNSVKISRELLEDMMREMDGNKKKVAESIGISRPTLYKLLKKYHVE